ncbi:MAG: BaeR [Pseudomonadota bacterium]|jgi:two-component system response regulator BaeR
MNAPPSSNPATVWVVEDDAKIADLLLNYLQASGFAAVHIDDGATALARLRAAAHQVNDLPDDRPHHLPDLLLLDLMLPGLDGLSLCKALREFSALPVIMLTARVDEIDRLLGLDIGADDYICKPFSPREVMARIRALLRRSQGQMRTSAAPPVQRKWEVHAEHYQIHHQGQLLPLTPVEFRLLQRLLSRPHHVFPRAKLLDEVHDDLRDVSDRAIDSHIKNLRKKIEHAGGDPACIASVYGVGYRFEG